MNRFFVRQNSMANQVNSTNDRSQRRTQFVGNGGEKLVFGAAGGFGFAAGRTFFFKQTRVVYGQRNAIGDQLQEARVVFGKLKPRESTDVHYADNPASDEQRH